MAESLEERITRLEKDIGGLKDRAEIIELTAKYCFHLARDERDEVVALYTEDGVFDRSSYGGTSGRGRAELLKTYPSGRAVPNFPTIHNHIIELNGDEARGFCVVESPTRGGSVGGFTGRYEDKYRRVNGKWRFAERKVFMLHDRSGQG